MEKLMYRLANWSLRHPYLALFLLAALFLAFLALTLTNCDGTQASVAV